MDLEGKCAVFGGVSVVAAHVGAYALTYHLTGGHAEALIIHLVHTGTRAARVLHGMFHSDDRPLALLLPEAGIGLGIAYGLQGLVSWLQGEMRSFDQKMYPPSEKPIV